MASNPSQSSSRRHHYVPQLILRRFAEKHKKGEYQIKIFDKQTNKEYLSNVRDAMVITDFHTLVVEGELIELENYVTSIEDRAAPIIAKILDNESINNISKEDHLNLSRFIALQFCRTVHHRTLFEEASKELSIVLAEKTGFEDFKELIVSSDDAKLMSFKSMTSELPGYTSIMASKDMILLKSPPGSEFIIGDNPASLWNDRPSNFFSNIGLSCVGIQIFLPLSSQYTLGLWCPSIKSEFIEKRRDAKRNLGNLRAHSCLAVTPIKVPPELEANLNSQISILEPLIAALETGHPLSIKAPYVTRLNSLQIKHAERFIGSKSGDFELLHKMLEDDTSYRTGPRMKVM